jgi:high-affinity Fe2+/Pb2+ permease
MPLKQRANGTKATVAGAVVALAAATIGLAVSFGVNLTVQQQQALLTFVTAAVVVAGVAHLSRKVKDVQETVNGKTEVLADRVDQLGATLIDHGVPVPPRPEPPDDG